jgi:hypothetical protein
MTIDVMKKKSCYLLIGVTLFVAALYGGQTLEGQSNACGMQRNDMPVIFCDTFSSAFPITNRSGQLDGVIWGTSRLAGGGTNWMPADIETCNNGLQRVSPPNDVIVCNGRMRQATRDGGTVTIFAFYPKQPFDFAGRTGTVSFDVTNNTSGNHGAWPEFWITNLPVPAPFTHGIQPNGFPCDFCSVPQHALGIRFAAAGGDCPNGWRADSAIIIRNYMVEEHGIFEGNTTGTQIRQTGCASLSSGPGGGLNHVEIRISQNTIDVYASDAGNPSSLRRINTITNANLSLTRGLIWIEDAHYNADKSPVPSTSNNTFAWDNVAFDGPATYRDLSFDVLDRNGTGYNGAVDLGWQTPVTLQTLPMTAANISAATRALLMFNFGVFTLPTTFNYTINGHAVSAPSPLPSVLVGQRSVALDVPLNYLVAGPQTVALSANQQISVQNVNIVLVAAAPVPGATPPTPPANLRIIRDLVFNTPGTWGGLLHGALLD